MIIGPLKYWFYASDQINDYAGGRLIIHYYNLSL